MEWTPSPLQGLILSFEAIQATSVSKHTNHLRNLRECAREMLVPKPPSVPISKVTIRLYTTIVLRSSIDQMNGWIWASALLVTIAQNELPLWKTVVCACISSRCRQAYLSGERASRDRRSGRRLLSPCLGLKVPFSFPTRLIQAHNWLQVCLNTWSRLRGYLYWGHAWNRPQSRIDSLGTLVKFPPQSLGTFPLIWLIPCRTVMRTKMIE